MIKILSYQFFHLKITQCFGEMCVDLSNVETFLNLDSTKEALNVPIKRDWTMCSDQVHLKFLSEKGKSASPYISEALDKNVPVLIYAGDHDYICNYLGVQAMVLDLNWGHTAEFTAVEDQPWGEGGIARSSDHGLTFLRVFDAGHMVPTDQPAVSLDMITQFLQGESFVTVQRGYVRHG
jgi:carboxypeptidase C (cathepsin A)